MTRITLLSAAFFLVVAWGVAFSNPIPPPIMEWLDIQVQPSSGTLRARVDGDYGFYPWADFPTSMTFPMPPESTLVGVWQETDPLVWEGIPDRYPTMVPEIPSLPMIRWFVQLPIELPPGEGQVTFHAIYEHDLLRRWGEFVYFYALGSGKYMTGSRGWYGLAAWITVHLPAGTHVTGVWLNQDLQPFTVDGDTLVITVFSVQEPMTRDLIILLIPPGMNDASGWVLR